mmetsp:Transcript_24932/g.24402  ORF Transcript_24932/g.24402 Transcript_24932/m.24402 type:complete len:103 (-) Transcript_24932:869-1177(-)
MKSSISDIVDRKEKEAVYQMRGLDAIKNQLPTLAQGFSMNQAQQMSSFMLSPHLADTIQHQSMIGSQQRQVIESFKKFKPRYEREEQKKKLINAIEDFTYMP